MQKHAEAIRKLWSEITPEAIAEGERWYPNARSLVFEWSMEYGMAEEAVAGVVAALSQRCHWRTNLERARAVLDGEDFPGGLGRAAAKAVAIRDGADPETTLGHKAWKVKAFYHALLGDDDAAVIDTWMLTALDWPLAGYSRLQYEKLAGIIAAEAEAAGLKTTHFQAALWCLVRGRSE